MQGLKQLKHLNLISSLQSCPTDESTPPAVAYSVLTSSSMLQYLDISGCLLPADVWQYLIPGGKQLPHLGSLGLSGAYQLDGNPAAPDGSRLVSCCPGLQQLNLDWVQCPAKLDYALQGLSGLHTLVMSPEGPEAVESLKAVCQLSGLRGLYVATDDASTDGVLLQLTQLKQLTYLCYHGFFDGSLNTHFMSSAEVSLPVK